MSNVIELTSEQKDAFFQVVGDLKDEIYPSENAFELMKQIDKEGLSSELFKLMKDKNIFLRIIKEIRLSKDLEKTVEELIKFYNDPKNENIWKQEY